MTVDGRTNPWLVLAGAVVIAVLLVDIGLSLRNTRALHQDAAAVEHTYHVLLGLERVAGFVQEAETNKRGSILTAEPRFLERYHAAIAEARAQVDTVDALTRDNAAQQARIPDLRARVERKIAEMERVLALRDTSGLEAARQGVIADAGAVEMQGVRTVIDTMAAAERALLAARSKRSDESYRRAAGGGLLSGALGLFAVSAFLLILRRHLSERRKAAAAIAEHGERLRTTLASIGDAVIATDLEARVTSLNPIAEQLTGWTTSDAAGRPLAEVFRIVNEMTREPAPNPVLRAIAEGAIVGLANHTLLVARDGREHPIEDSAAPIRGEDGAIFGCVLVFRDVTGRRAADLALAESEERLRLAVRAADAATWVWDMPTGILRGDERLAFLYNLDTDELARGMPIERGFDRVDPEDADRVHRDVMDAVLNARPFEIEFRMKGRDGALRWLRCVGRVEVDDDGKPMRTSGAVLDMTERKRVEQELSDSDRRKDEFIATLAHELRNPLAPLRNCLQILSVARDGEAAAAARAMMERQLSKMVGLIDDLLDLSRISQGKIELRKERVDLGRLVFDTIETTRPSIEQAGHAIHIAVPDVPVFVDGDVTRLSQVFTNLLTNAAKYTERGGRIDVTLSPDAVVTVRDTGIGIPQEMLPKIFDMFTQVDRSIERSEGGLGIGLWLVRRLVELHGGTVEAQSDGPGKGSTFVVRLPRATGPATTAAAAPSASSPHVGRRIVVVDDNRDSAMSLALMLQLMGNEVRTAHDGAEGIEAAAAFRPDVMLLDLGMPRLNGYDAARKIREQPWGKDLVLVALTGWGQDSDRARSREAGFDHHLVKPVEPATLERLLAETTPGSV
jgi:PAS domain S-box-containing protein